MNEVLGLLQERGVILPHPESVYIAEEVNPERISPGVVLHPGTRLQGESLWIGEASEIGGECPATLIDCQLGRKVELKGGFYQGAVFLDGSNMGSSAHVRPGTLLEEQASAAHAVGLKQSILFPFVALGSLINFCDVFMAGGRSRKDHSEVGSSFIHFNFTPHADKATASLLGNVPEGVFLDQPPIFLGGQGGIVGPVQMAFGSIQGAGSVCRKDVLEPNQLYLSGGGQERYQPYTVGRPSRPAEKWAKNLEFLGQLQALECWYRSVRVHWLAEPLLEGALRQLSAAKKERHKRLLSWATLWPEAPEAPELPPLAEVNPLLHEWAQAGRATHTDYLEWVKGLDLSHKQQMIPALRKCVETVTG